MGVCMILDNQQYQEMFNNIEKLSKDLLTRKYGAKENWPTGYTKSRQNLRHWYESNGDSQSATFNPACN